jgi:nucleoside-diphosphate-sugar epimerase
MARVVVTGGAGFIGSHLIDRLLLDNHEVHVIDNFATGRRVNIEHVLNDITLHEIDLRDAEAVKNAIDGAEYVLHQGALPSVPRSVENPRESNDVNANGTLNVLIAAKETGVKRVVYAASSSAYGESTEIEKHEKILPRPISPYGVAKLTGEQYCVSFFETYGLETVCLRYFNVFGPRQNPDSPYTGVMAIFIPLMLQGKQPIIFGDGEQTRDFTYINNNVHANILAMTAEKAVGEVINIACGDNQTVNFIQQKINTILGTSIEPIYKPERTGDIKHSCAKIDKARELLNFSPVASFEDGLSETIEWYRKELNL